jgi:uncharacterized protein (TIGR03437 family)
LAVLSLVPALGFAQTTGAGARWRPVGNQLQLLGLPSPAGGRADRVWFSAGGSGLRVLLAGGEVWGTENLETWSRREESAPMPETAESAKLPEALAKTRARSVRSAVVYAAGRDAWRSVNGGSTWENLTGYRGSSILGGRIRELAVHPDDDDRIAVASDTGVWLSLDGGSTWTGLNEGLPGFRVRRITAAAEGVTGIRVQAESAGTWTEMEWMPGQKAGWVPILGGRLDQEAAMRAELSALAGTALTSVAWSGDSRFAASADGHLWTSLDRGRTWRESETGAGEIEQIWAHPADGRVALAVTRGQAGLGARVLRTVNGGAYWDDLTANLAPGAITGIAVDRRTGAVYVASARGVYWTFADLLAPSPAAGWMAVEGVLPAGILNGVTLDGAGAQLLASVDGHGVYALAAPHLAARPVVVHAADFSQREAAPGALLTLAGIRAGRIAAAGLEMAALPAADGESQFQLPFALPGDSIRLEVSAGGQALAFPLRLRETAPAVLMDREGTPFVLDAESGVAIDAMNPLRGGMRIQILATGLGRVTPDWPAGAPAPDTDTPRVVAKVSVRIDGVELGEIEAKLAPGYTGFYLIEATLPAMLDAGPAELRVEAGGNQSGPVRVYIGR